MSLPHFGIIKKDPDWMSSDNRFMYKQIMCVNKFCFEKKTPGIRPCVYSHSQEEFNMAWQLYHMNAGNLSVALQYKQKEPPIDKSQPLWKKKILCQKCLADKPEPSCAYAHSDVEAAAAAPAEATVEAATAPTAPTAATAPIDKSNSSWRKQIICQKCPPNQPPKASCGYSHSCMEFEAAWSLANQKQADEEKAQKEKEEKAQEEKAQKEKEEKAQKVKEAKAQKAKEAKEKKEQEEKEAKEKKEQEEKAQKEKEEKAQKVKEARAQKAKEAKEAKEQEEKAAAALQEQKEKEEKEEKAQKAKEARAQKVKAQKEAPPPPYEPQPPSPPPIIEDDNVSTTSTSSKKKPAKEKIPSAVKRIVWNTYIGKDNLKGTCLCCNSEEVTVTNFECGHVKSEKNGGEVTVYNLRPICSNCNKSVGANDMDDFMKRYGISTPKNWNGLGSACAATATTAAPKSKKDK